MSPSGLETSEKTGIGSETYAQQESKGKSELKSVVVALHQAALIEEVVVMQLFSFVGVQDIAIEICLKVSSNGVVYPRTVVMEAESDAQQTVLVELVANL